MQQICMQFWGEIKVKIIYFVLITFFSTFKVIELFQTGMKQKKLGQIVTRRHTHKCFLSNAYCSTQQLNQWAGTQGNTFFRGQLKISHQMQLGPTICISHNANFRQGKLCNFVHYRVSNSGLRRPVSFYRINKAKPNIKGCQYFSL